MGANVVAGKIGQHPLITIAFSFEDQALFFRQFFRHGASASQVQAELECHVETWEIAGRCRLDS